MGKILKLNGQKNWLFDFHWWDFGCIDEINEVVILPNLNAKKIKSFSKMVFDNLITADS